MTSSSDQTQYWRYPCPTILNEISLIRHSVIEASAGTGKTYTLEHIVVDKLVRTELTLNQILVMTFTEKATAELKLRIRTLLTRVILRATPMEGALPKNSSMGIQTEGTESFWIFDSKIRQKLEESLFGFNEAAIFTIHGFCHRVLRDHAFVLGEPLSQDRIDMKHLLKESWQELLIDELPVNQSLRDVIRKQLETQRPEELFKKLKSAFESGYHRNALCPDEHIAHALNAFEKLRDLEKFRECVAVSAIKTDPKADLLRELQSLLNLIEEIEAPYDRLSEINWSALLTPGRHRKGKNQIKYPDELDQGARQIYEAIDSLANFSTMKSSADFHFLEHCLPILVNRAHDKKMKTFSFDFDDLLNRLHKEIAVQENPKLIAALQSQYRCALIDEFQDTDKIQWAIAKRIFIESDDAQLIVIGDPKQSIYRFRGAEIHTYMEALTTIRSLYTPPRSIVRLTKNYRSSAELIDAFNWILDQDTPRAFFNGQVRYDAPVSCGNDLIGLQSSTGASLKALVMLPFQRPGKTPIDVIRRHYEARIADEIDTLLKTETQLIEKDGSCRALTPADMMILVRTNNEGRGYEQALTKKGLPVVRGSSESLFESDEALELLRLLKAIQTPQRPDGWIQAFMTAFFDYNPETIFSVSQEPPSVALRKLAEWHEMAERGRLTNMLAEVEEWTRLLFQPLLNDLAERRLINFRALLQCCAAEIQTQGLTLDALINWLADIIEKKNPAPSPYEDKGPASENVNSVQILTFHKSKGLEAPIVFLGGGFGLFPPALLSRFDDHSESFIALRKHLPGQIRAHIQTAELEEEQRILYVAMTRASARLYLPLVKTLKPMQGMYEHLNKHLQDGLDNRADSLSNYEVSTEVCHSSFPRKSSKQIETIDVMALQKALEPVGIDFSDSARRITSYSRLKIEQAGQKRTATNTDHLITENQSAAVLDPENDLLDEFSEVEENGELLIGGGKQMGLVLHDCLELIDFAPYVGLEYDNLQTQSDVVDVVLRSMSTHSIETGEFEGILRTLWRTAHAQLSLTDDLTLPPLATLNIRHEMEFLYPFPFDTPTPEGYIRGFIDGLFEHNGKFYWLDWKSDRLNRYTPESIRTHVTAHYQLQAHLYNLALLKLLRITNAHDFEQKFGGLIYVYLRGLPPVSQSAVKSGYFFAKPTFEDLTTFSELWQKNGLNAPPAMHLTADGVQAQ